MIDKEGYRLNVGIILIDVRGYVFWARRAGKDAWQFPQGGLQENETIQEAMFRELKEEVGLEACDVEVLGVTRRWLHYRLPKHFVRRHSHPRVIGQKQKWFLLKFIADESHIKLDTESPPEFDCWKWVDYWHPLQEVIYFKKRVYQKALAEFEPLVQQHIHLDVASVETS